MGWRAALLAAVVIGGACSTGPSDQSSKPVAQTSASASRLPSTSASVPPSTSSSVGSQTPSAPNASAGPFGVTFGSGPGGIKLTIVGTDGHVYGLASPRYRSGNNEFPPTVSTTSDAAYYLDGDSSLMRLQPGGTPVHVRDLPGTPSVRVTFAVRADDKKIAVAALTYGPTPTGPGVGGPNYLGMKLYVEDLDGSNRVDLFSSATIAEWPIGWHGSNLVIAVSSPQIGGLGLDPYPYYAFAGIHVVDALSGVRTATLCSGSAVLGLATPEGLLCAAPSGTVESDWAGNVAATGLQCSSAQLQPGGSAVACTNFGETPFLWSSGSKHPLPTPSAGPDPFAPLCWIGHDHLLLKSPYTGPVLYNIDSGTTEPIDTLADWVVGAIPGAL